jgi:hypothetical protein
MPKKRNESPDQRLAREVRDLNQRVAGVLGVTKLTLAVQFKSLAAAEKLRKLAQAVADSEMDATSLRVSAFATLANKHKLAALRAFLKDLPRFHKPVKLPKGLR